MFNSVRHLVDSCDVLLFPPLLLIPMMRRHIMGADACDNAMLTRVCISICLCLSTARVFVLFVYVPLLVRSCIRFTREIALYSPAVLAKKVKEN
jgi:hypothetical protein